MPKPNTYKIRIDKQSYEVSEPTPTGRQLLETAGKPAANYKIFLRPPGQQPQEIGLDDTVDLTKPGVERFVTLPLDQTEG